MKTQDFLQDIGCIMKVKSKDDIVIKLIDKIQLRQSNTNVPHIETYHDGWCSALKWVLSIEDLEKHNGK